MNGKALKLTEKGGFAVDVTLKPGKNTFTFVSNGKTVTFTVTYTLTILKSVSPSQAMTMAGGSTVGFSAIARKGSKVTVAFNGKTYTMKASPLKEEEGADDPALSDFENYLASVTLPAGKAGQSQKLGTATFTGIYNGLKETKKSGRHHRQTDGGGGHDRRQKRICRNLQRKHGGGLFPAHQRLPS